MELDDVCMCVFDVRTSHINNQKAINLLFSHYDDFVGSKMWNTNIGGEK